MQKLLEKAKKTKQKKSNWYVISEPAPTWVGEDEESLTRPFITLVADLDKDLIRHISITDSKPTDEEVLHSILQAITKPGGGIGLGLGFGLGGKFRPTIIQVNNAALLEKIRPLNQINIECQQTAKPDLIVNMLRDLEQHLTGREYRSGLLRIPKVTHPLLEELYTAAEAYYLDAPYEIISDSEPIAIRFPPEAPPKYAVIMGYGGEEYGLAIYDDLQQLVSIYSGLDPQNMTDESIVWLAILYDLPHYLPFEDLDAIAEYGWPIAAEDAYPLVTRLRPAVEGFELPDEAEIRMLAAALRAIPEFVDNNVDEEEYPIMGIDDVVFELPPIYGHQAIALNWAEVDDLDLAMPFDLDDLDEDEVEALTTEGQVAMAEFIEGWDIDEEDEQAYGEAMALGAFMLTYVNMVYMEAVDSSITNFEYLADLCWEIGSLLVNYADSPADIKIFTGPPRFVEEYTNEFAEDEEDVENYLIVWQDLGNFVHLVEAFGESQAGDEK